MEDRKMENKLLELLKAEFADIDFETNAALIDEGILDSIRLVELISLISVEFGVTIPYDEIVPDNFNSLNAMSAMIERLQGE